VTAQVLLNVITVNLKRAVKLLQTSALPERLLPAQALVSQRP
jgi:hypothetical protein